MSRNHMASCGQVSGRRRIGTRYAHTPEECWEIMGKPFFRFRNDEERLKFFEWQSALSAAPGEAK